MTQQVRKSYRNHRKATWAGVLALTVAIAAIVIPIASGASDKTYTLRFGATTPAAESGSTPANQKLCLGTPTYSLTLTLTNTAKTVNLGSANITFPGNVALSGDPSIASASPGYTKPANATATRLGNVVSLRNLSLTNSNNANALSLTVNLSGSSTAAPQPRNISGLIKQSNDFNDAGGNANTFESPPTGGFPTITVQTCVITITGTVFHDDEGDGSVAGDTSLQSPPFPSHTVTLTGGTSPKTAPVQSDGTYTATVPKGPTYTVCIDDQIGDVQTFPVDNTCGTNVGGYMRSSDSGGNHFGLVGGVTAACNSAAPLPSQFESADPPATVIARFSGTCKNAGKPFVFTTYDDPTGGRVARLSPVGSQSGTECCQIVAQQITWDLTGSSPELKTLTYDDPPFDQSGDPRTMLFCKKDPFDRTVPDGVTLLTGSGYLPADILPTGETTCLARTTQGRFLDEDDNWVTRRIDDVYSAYDGKVNLT